MSVTYHCWSGRKASASLAPCHRAMATAEAPAPDVAAAPVGGPPDACEVLASLSHGSAVTAMDELPKAVLRHVASCGLAALVEILRRLSDGDPSELLTGVLHLCLRKKEPAWLLKNSRPVLLEPYLRRLESSIVFRRLQRFLELHSCLPSSMLAYRRQLSPQDAAVLGRQLLACWTADGSEVHIADWDEENAFCNVPRHAARDVVGEEGPGLAAWLQQFYGALQVFLVTPFGLAGPYQLQHGGAQGDSMGVGWYLFVGKRRTEFHRGILAARVHPADLSSGGPPPHTLCFSAPSDNSLLIPELSYSDDRRFLARTADGLAHLLEIAAHGCWAAGGVVNGAKLQIFRVGRQGGRLTYLEGHVDTLLGPLDYQRGGLALCKIPLLMGEVPCDAIAKTLARAHQVQAACLRLQPPYALVLRVVLVFVVSRLDYLYGALPPTAASLAPLQRVLDAVLLRSLRAPPSTPTRQLHAPLVLGGFGAPVLELRFQLRFLRGFFRALNSRNLLVRESTRAALARGPVGNEDVVAFQSICRRGHLSVVVVPSPEAHPSIPAVVIQRPWAGGDVVLVSDGSSPDGRLGWGALVADVAGGVLATSADGVACDMSFSWAAEWAGKLAAVRLAQHLGIPPTHMRWSVADNLSAVLGSDGGRPSQSPRSALCDPWQCHLLQGSPGTTSTGLAVPVFLPPFALKDWRRSVLQWSPRVCPPGGPHGGGHNGRPIWSSSPSNGATWGASCLGGARSPPVLILAFPHPFLRVGVV